MTTETNAIVFQYDSGSKLHQHVCNYEARAGTSGVPHFRPDFLLLHLRYWSHG